MSRLLLLCPLLVFLTLSYLLPLAGVMWQSVTVPEPGLQNYATVLSDPLVWSVIQRTLYICITVTLTTVVLAYALTLLWVRGSPLIRTLVELCIMIPFWLSVLSRSFGWLSLLSNRGLLNSWLEALGLIDAPLSLVRNDFAVMVGMVHFLIPFAVFPLAGAIRNVDERVLMAARGFGASRLRVFWQIFVPMTASGIYGALLLVFVFSIGFYIVPTLLGGGRSVMVAELIYLRIFQIPEWGIATALSALIMVTVSGLLVAMIRRVGIAR